jgi:AcrR family transcriptional regulator
MTIYRSWSDMDQLLGDLMTREWGLVVSAAATDGRQEGTVERIVGTALRAVRALRDNELFVRIVELDPELLLPYLLSRRGRSQQAILDLVVGQLREGQAAGEVREADPEVLARALLLSTHGFVLSAHTMVDDHASEEALDEELRAIVTRAVLP